MVRTVSEESDGREEQEKGGSKRVERGLHVEERSIVEAQKGKYFDSGALSPVT